MASDSSLQVIAAEFPFNDELTRLWAQCGKFAASISNSSHFIDPLHLALVLLHDDLEGCDDTRLLGVPLTTLEHSLFWIVISRVSLVLPADKDHARIKKTLVEHVRATHFQNEAEREPSTPMSIGQAMWRKVEERPNQDPPTVTIDDTNGILRQCNEATRLILARAKAICDAADDLFMASHHVLLALLEYQDIIVIIEGEHKLSVTAMADAIRDLRRERVSERESLPRFKFLNEFAADLTKLAQKKEIGPIIGRNHEIRRLIAILSRKLKNNAVLLGDPGVGKTAIAQGLALMIAKGEVPELLSCRVFELDLGGLLASTACKSAYEQILQAILDEIAQHDQMGISVILFMDELSQITTGGYREDGVGIDAATLMKPFLAQGKLRCIGCSTFEDFKNSVEKDGALARHFSSVFVCEPTGPETVEVLRGLKDGFQKFHDVRILDEAFIAAVSIATQFFSHKRLPDVAIELVDDACSLAKIGTNERWERLAYLKRRKVAIQIDMESLNREIDEASEKKLVDVLSQMHDIKQEIDRVATETRVIRPIRTKVQELELQIQEVGALMKKHGQAGEREEKVKCMQKIFELRELKLQEENKLQVSPPSGVFTVEPQPAAESPPVERRVISQRTVAQAASWHTFIPSAEPLNFAKGTRILKVYDDLSKVVVAQPEAVAAVASAVRCMLAGLTDPSRPVASFLFGGPSGSGKMLLTKELSSFLLRSNGKLIRINGSDYATPHSLSRLIGTPACTGFDKGGQLTECVRRRPFSIVHIHQIENACPEFRLKIQTILDEGFLKDGAGKVVDFRNCIVIMTTSVGQAVPRRNGHDERQHFLKEIQEWFSVEFLARIDELIVFRRITADAMAFIVDARLEEIKKQLSRIKLHLEVEEDVKSHLMMDGWSPISGARPLESVIRAHLILPLSSLLLEDQIHDDWTVLLRYDYDQERICIEPLEPVPVNVIIGQTNSNSPSSSFTSFKEDTENNADSSASSFILEGETPFCGHLPSGSGPPVLQLAPQRLY